MNYRVLLTDEAANDIFDLCKYIYTDLRNPDAANRLYEELYKEMNDMGDFPRKYSDSGIGYRGYIIHKKVYQSYLLFYIINDNQHEVYVLRVLKNIMNWHKILEETKIYHFSDYS